MRRHERRLTCYLLSSLLLLQTEAAAIDAELGSAKDTQELMDSAFRNFFGYSYVQRANLEIELANGRRLHRTLDIAHSREEGNSRWWIYYRSPEYLRGTAVLRIGRDDGDDEHFLYSPEIQRVRRVSGAQRADKMAGTDFSFEDLDIVTASQFDLSRRSLDEVGGIACVLVDGKPHFDSMYERREWCIDPKRKLILRMRGYGPNSVLLKTLEADVDSVSAVQGIQVVRRMTMADAKRGTRTFFEVETVRVEPELPSDLFSSGALDRRTRTPYLDD